MPLEHAIVVVLINPVQESNRIVAQACICRPRIFLEGILNSLIVHHHAWPFGLVFLQCSEERVISPFGTSAIIHITYHIGSTAEL